MERYDYHEVMIDDVKAAIWSRYTTAEIKEKLADRDELEQELNDDLWIDDSVTGNASGSYYCNAWRAEAAIAHNWDLLAEALREFGCEVDVLANGAEWCDVTIRCYLLGDAISAVLDELEEYYMA